MPKTRSYKTFEFRSTDKQRSTFRQLKQAVIKFAADGAQDEAEVILSADLLRIENLPSGAASA